MGSHRSTSKRNFQYFFILWVYSLHCSLGFVVRYDCIRPPTTGDEVTTSMGARISAQSDDTLDPITPERRPKRRVQQKEQKKAEAAAWKREVEQFAALALDPSYVTYPVRRPTIKAATLYPTKTTTTSPTLLPGSHKHLGGAYDPTDGCIYGVPANAPAILCLYPDVDSGEYQMTSIPLPERIRSRSYKWLRGIFAHGYLWAIPAWADCVLCVDVDAYWGRREASTSNDEIVQLLDLPAGHTPSQWQWHGAGINQEQTAIYCIPSNAQHVLKVDCETKTTSLIDIEAAPQQYPSFTVATRNKWYGGIRGADNCVYGIPYRSGAVLQIDCATDTARLIGPDYGLGQYNWHGGIAVAGKIYAHPSHAKTVLVIDTNKNTTTAGAQHQTTSPHVYELPIPGYEDSTETYKWLGGSVGADGNIYCPACDTSAILKIDVQAEVCITYGATGTEKNKWQGGVLARDGCIYCIPASGVHVCRISPNTAVQLVGDLSPHKDKWQGGHVGKDGCLYFIPENGYRVLKVTPPMEPPTLVDGTLPEGDVLLEFL